MILRVLPEQNLEKRSVAGGYVYVLAWLIIGFMTDYVSDHPVAYTVAMAFLLIFAAGRIWVSLTAGRQDNYFKASWQWLLIINALGPALVYGIVFAYAMQHVEHYDLFIYLFMINIALLSGATVTYSPNRALANCYLAVIAAPALVVTLTLPGERGVEGMMLALYMFFNVHMIRMLNSEFKERITQKKKLEELARRDSLTGLFNRRYFDETLQLCWASHQRKKAPLAMLMLDIDNFKRINDQFGHPVGDEVIKRVASVIQNNFQREADIIARLGGEEIAVLVQETSFEQTRDLANSVCRQIASNSIDTGKGPASVTVSIGVAHAQPRLGFDHEDFYKLADDCLYQAKDQGKNQVVAKSI